MTRGPASEFERLLNDSLDGSLSPEDAAALERAITSDPDCAKQAEAQHEIDERLRRLFDPPECPGLEAAPVKRHLTGWGRFVAVAAGILLIVGVAYISWPASDGPGYAPPPSAGELHQAQLDAGFRPLWICEDEAEFREYTQLRLGIALRVEPTPGVELVGWTTRGGRYGMPGEQILLARVDGQPVVVLVSRGQIGPEPRDLPSEQIRPKRRQVDEIVLWELGPGESAAVIGGFEVAPVPESPNSPRMPSSEDGDEREQGASLGGSPQ